MSTGYYSSDSRGEATDEVIRTRLWLQKKIMMKIIFDTNIYDKIELDEAIKSRVSSLVCSNRLCVIATPKVIDELRQGPFRGLPDWFPICYEPESVAVCGHARSGMARLGDGRDYTEHRGGSNNIADAIISDSAAAMADILVSEDQRLVKRFNDLRTHCIAMRYATFREWLFTEAAKGRSEAL